jgi:hypothetical protein
LVRNAVHLAVLCSFAIAQQYFEPLADGADFFVSRGSTGLDVVVYAVGLVLVPPAVLALLEALAGVAGKRWRDGLHLVFVGGLAALIVWQALTGGEEPLPARVTYLMALIGGAAAAFAYHRVAAASFALTVLSPAPIVVLALFLVFSPVRALVFGGEPQPEPHAASGTPVVVVLLDELPVASLMNARRRIDARRYPNFARLARDSTWYRNAASVGDYTQIAVPAVLTGRPGTPGRLQVAHEYPDNLFTLLGGTYRLDVFEQVTDLCRKACPVQRRAPFSWRMRSILSTSIGQIPALPHALRVRLADALYPGPAPNEVATLGRRSVRNHVPAAQDVRFERFLETLDRRRGRTLSFIHLILPHRPWHYLPTGQSYVSRRSYSESLFARWPHDPWPSTVGYQRHLLQLEFVDRLMGHLVQRLKEVGLYDRAVIVVTADHGASFRPDDEPRILTRTNVGDVASVPLFVRAPGQRRGRIEDSAVDSTDILALIASQLGVRIPWSTGARSRTKLTIYREQDGGSVAIGRRHLEELRDAAVARKLELFAGGDPFRIGPHRELIGARLSAVATSSRTPIRATLDAPEQFRAVDPRARTIPIDVSGVVSGAPARSRAIAVALNGRIAATGWTIVDGGGEHFTVLLPPGRLSRGRAAIEVYAIGRGPGGVRLAGALND